ncbi:MAG: hypothetical protein QM534_03275 [Sediminibacterium sp.]|nr:hypothetical protein [Sediminibacterium sp.]
MKKRFYIIILILFCLTVMPSLAQNPKVEALKVEFISQKLNLTDAESKSFWPVYNECADKQKAIRKNYRQTMNHLPQELTDEKAKEVVNLEVQTRQAELELEKTYNDKLKAIIGVKKLAKLKQAEFEFKRKVLETVKQQSD